MKPSTILPPGIAGICGLLLIIGTYDALKDAPMAIKDIKVVETFKEGQSIYAAK